MKKIIYTSILTLLFTTQAFSQIGMFNNPTNYYKFEYSKSFPLKYTLFREGTSNQVEIYYAKKEDTEWTYIDNIVLTTGESALYFKKGFRYAIAQAGKKPKQIYYFEEKKWKIE